MEIIAVLLICAAVFGLCFGVDKAFVKLFRNQAEHKSGTAVRLNKKYASIGLIVAVLGLAGLFYGFSTGWVMIAGGVMLMCVGVGLVVYYMTFGVFYAQDSFILTSFGKKDITYTYKQITAQKLYMNYSSVLIELYMDDGNTIHVQSNMDGVYPFLDHAFAAWLRQTGRKQEDCAFYDPHNSCWFPNAED